MSEGTVTPKEERREPDWLENERREVLRERRQNRFSRASDEIHLFCKQCGNELLIDLGADGKLVPRCEHCEEVKA